MKTFLIIFVASLAASCGQSANNLAAEKEEVKATDRQDWSLMVNSKESLPQCTTATEGRLAYVGPTKTLTACQSSQWVDVSFMGPAGAAGAAGQPGAAGPVGQSGANGKDSLVSLDEEPAGANCKFSGKAIKSGNDADGNGKLEQSEVKNTQYVCNGANGLKISGVWKYFDSDVNTNDPDVADATLYMVNIGEIQFTSFEDGSAFLQVEGSVWDTDSNDDIVSFPYAHGFFISPVAWDKQEITLKKKFGMLSYTLEYKLKVWATNPTISIGLGYSNNAKFVSFPLTKQ